MREPAADHRGWARLPLPPGIETSDQGEGDLGKRLGRVARRALPGEDRVLLIGADCPGLSAHHLRRGAETLDYYEAALYPALDGGYPLLGLRVYHAPFDAGFLRFQLEASAEVRCAMREFVEAFGEWSDWHGSYRWQKLNVAAAHVGLDLDGSSHRAINDCQATRAVWRYLAGGHHENGYYCPLSRAGKP